MNRISKGIVRNLAIAVLVGVLLLVAVSFLAGPPPRREGRKVFGLQARSVRYVEPTPDGGAQVRVALWGGTVDDHDAVLVLAELAAYERTEDTITVVVTGSGKAVSYDWSRGSKAIVKFEGAAPQGGEAGSGDAVAFIGPITVADFSMLDSTDWKPDFRPWSEWPAYEAELQAEEAEEAGETEDVLPGVEPSLTPSAAP